MQAVHVDAPEAILGTIAPVHIDRASANSLAGTLCRPVGA